MKNENWLEREMCSQIININEIVDDRYDEELFDVYEDLRIKISNDQIDYNLGEIERRLTQKEYYTVMDDLGLSNSDVELGYGAEVLSEMVNTGEILNLTYENEIVWNKGMGKEVYEMPNGFTQIYDSTFGTTIIKCPMCSHEKYFDGEFICPECGFTGFERKHKIDRSKGELYVAKKLKELNLDFKEEVIEIGKFRYDFIVYKNNTKYYIEVHGKQHYEAIDYFGGEEKFQKQLKHDLIKKKHANENGVYVELDYKEHNLKLLENRFNENFINKYKIIGGK